MKGDGTLRSNLITARLEKGYTQLILAQMIGTSVRNYQYLESGTSGGSMKLWQKLSLILNKDIDHLFT
jgi:DNA-binding XRE family transcriptional regulator